MKTIQILFIAITCFAIISCKKSVNPFSLLPPITDTGANTFGCLVNGVAMLPRDGVATFFNPYPNKGVEVLFSPYDIVDISIYNARDGASSGFFLRFHFSNFSLLQPGDYEWKQSSFGTEAFPYYYNHVYGSFYNSTTNNYSWFGSYDSSGKITVNRFDATNHIISVTFSGKLREKNGTMEISIDNGRFDINWKTVADKKFR
ncbi:hypothetical protein [Hydrotalea flava]|uniref:hypothetical protein n=1 Tax=Hydrotalea flava TaxID=714549 RepID=UPI000834FDC8|nr:hypothetical protein [Hydrotalea flava]